MRKISFEVFLLIMVLIVSACSRANQMRPISSMTDEAASFTPTMEPPQASDEVFEEVDTPTVFPSATMTYTPSPSATHTPVITLMDIESDTGYLLPLRVQHLEPNRASFFFELQRPEAGYLLFKLADEQVGWSSRAFDASSQKHQIVLDNLKPEQDYIIQVGIGKDGETLRVPSYRGKPWGPLRVTTPSDPMTSLRVAVVGDSGFGESQTFELIEEMAAHAPDFVIHTGDVVYRVEEQATPVDAFAKKFFYPFQPILERVPVYPVVGNHELDAATYWKGMPMYYSVFPPFEASGFESNIEQDRNAWYGFSYGPYRFLMLDTQTFFNEPGRSEQTEWLKSALQEDDGVLYTILVTHVPFYSSGPHAREDIVVREEWVPLLEDASVPLVLSGHDHFYERLVADNRQYVVSGGGSSVLYNKVNPSSFSLTYYKETHFLLLDISPDTIRIRAIMSDGGWLEDVIIPLSVEER